MVKEQAYIGLGSNLGDSLHYLRSAIQAFSDSENCDLLAVSHLYKSAPVGPVDQPPYLNAVAKLLTSLSAAELLAWLQTIEAEHHRTREIHWGPRTLDLDILLYGEQQIDTEILTVPHPEIANRLFVLQPLADISPNLVLPDSKRLEDLIKAHDTGDLERVMDAPQLLASQ